MRKKKYRITVLTRHGTLELTVPGSKLNEHIQMAQDLGKITEVKDYV